MRWTVLRLMLRESKFPRAKPCPRAMVILGPRTDQLLNSAIQHLNPDRKPISIDSCHRVYQVACSGKEP